MKTYPDLQGQKTSSCLLLSEIDHSIDYRRYLRFALAAIKAADNMANTFSPCRRNAFLGLFWGIVFAKHIVVGRLIV